MNLKKKATTGFVIRPRLNKMEKPMNSLAQYIELYNRNISLVNDGSTDIMNRMRPEALDILNNTELPKKGSENF